MINFADERQLTNDFFVQFWIPWPNARASLRRVRVECLYSRVVLLLGDNVHYGATETLAALRLGLRFVNVYSCLCMSVCVLSRGLKQRRKSRLVIRIDPDAGAVPGATRLVLMMTGLRSVH